MTKAGAVSGFVKFFGAMIPIIGIVAIFNIPLYLTGWSPFNQQYQALFWTFVISLIFLTKPATKNAKGVKWYDLFLIALTFISGLYITIFYFEIQETMGIVSSMRVVLGAITVLVLLESTRRVAGWPIVIIILVFIVYAKFGKYFPGLLETKSMSWKRLFTFLYLNGDAWLGVPLRVVLYIVTGFLIMGRVFFETGGGDTIIGLAESLMGRFRGGPAKVAVLASSLFGAVSGSTVGNVASTGVITIPMMKRTGFTPEYAAAVEVVASNGGQILPPVMGAAAFIMSEFLGVGYPVIVLAAIGPALLYYLAVILQVHLQAVSHGSSPMPVEARPSFKALSVRGWPLIFPIAFLFYALFFLWMPPGIAAIYTAAILVVISFFRKATRKDWNWRKVMTILEKTSRTTMEVTAISASAGLVVGIVSYTGLGMTLSRILTELAGGHLLPLALLTAFASIVLGMGMPPGPAYILLAVLAAPALIDVGIAPVTAHIFVFYFGILSMVTPPVCIAVYTAAAIAESPYMMKCARHAVKLSIGAFIVPFVMLYKPGLNFIGSTQDIVLSMTTTAVGIIIFAIVLEGFLTRRMSWLERGAWTISGIAIMGFTWQSRLAGFALAILLFFWHVKGLPKKKLPIPE